MFKLSMSWSTNLRVICLLCLGVNTLACVSSGDYESLERKNKLLTLERNNLKHDKQSLQTDLKRRQADLSKTEQQLNERVAESTELRNSVNALNESKKQLVEQAQRWRELSLAYQQWMKERRYEGKSGVKDLLQRTDTLVQTDAKNTATNAADQVTH